MIKANGNTVVALFLLAVFSILLIVGLSYDYYARLLPLVVTIPGIIFSAAQLISDLIKNNRQRASQNGRAEGDIGEVSSSPQAADEEKDKIPLKNHFMAIGWVTSFFISVLLLGFHMTIIAFVVIFSKSYTRMRWLTSFALTGICWTSVYIIFNRTLGVILYNGILIEYVKNVLYYR